MSVERNDAADEHEDSRAAEPVDDEENEESGPLGNPDVDEEAQSQRQQDD